MQGLALVGAAASAAVLLLAAAYEATFMVVARSTLEKLVENGVPRAAWLLRAYEPRHRLRLLGRAGAGLGAAGLALSARPLLASLAAAHHAAWVRPTPAALLVTLVMVVLSSAPRRLRLADDAEETRVPAAALCFVVLHAVLSPVLRLLDALSIAESSDEDLRAEKEGELRSLVESESENGVIQAGEREMIQGVFGFHDRIVREVMVPRVDIKAIEISSSVADLLDLIRRTGHSRVPVYRETLDHVCGIVYAKDLLHLLVGREDVDPAATTIASLRDRLGSTPAGSVPLLHAPHFVPETKKIDALLHDMRSSRIRLAVVLDEYGGTAGLVSTEDLIEEIVGEIQDEYDDEEELYQWVEPQRTLIANARIDIDDLNELLQTDLPSEGFETLGGFILDHLGSIPREGQIIQTANLQFSILQVDGQRIARVQITRLTPTSGAGPRPDDD